MLLRSYCLINQEILLAKAQADSGVRWNVWVELVDMILKIKLRLLELLSCGFSSILVVERDIRVITDPISRNNSAMQVGQCPYSLSFFIDFYVSYAISVI